MDGLGTLLQQFSPALFPRGHLGFPRLSTANYFFRRPEKEEILIHDYLADVLEGILTELQGKGLKGTAVRTDSRVRKQQCEPVFINNLVRAVALNLYSLSLILL